MSDDVIQAAHYINGQWRREGVPFISTASHDGSLVCEAVAADESVVNDAVLAAREAFEHSGWKERPARERAAVLLELADRLEARVEPVARLMAREMGKPYRLAYERELIGAVDKFRYFAGVARALDGTTTGASPAHLWDMTVATPVGVCALIVPWNDPVDLAVRKLGAALAAGCTAVIKSSEETPASTQVVAEICDGLAGLPSGVVNLVHGYGEPTGSALVAHPEIDKVSFTGSTATGKRIMRDASAGLKRVSLECGGKAPSLVFADADRTKCLDALSYGAFLYSGQSCTAATRIIVERPYYEEFVAELAERALAMPVGDPLLASTLIGPMVSQRQVDRVRGFLDSAQRDGAQFVIGGEIDGLYISPTILTGVRPDSLVAQEEIFGPVVVVMPADDEETAIAIANGVKYGLGASVWTNDINRALRVAGRLEAGDVWVNTHYVRQSETSFGGWKESGIGRELGLDGIKEYVAYKRVAIDTSRDFHLKAWFERDGHR